MDSILHDIRYALRILRKSPGFTLVSLLTLTLGIVGTTIVFTAYKATMWQAVPVKDPDHLAVLSRRYRKGGENSEFSTSDYRRIRDQARAFSGVVAESDYDTVLAQMPALHSDKPDEARPALVKFVSANYFDVLGVDASIGRIFTAKQDADAPVAILSHSSWHRRFRDDPAVLGRTVAIYGAAVTIVGIMPADFIGTGSPPVPPDFWLPLSAQALVEPQRVAQGERDPWLRVVGRLQPAVSAAQADAEITALEQHDEQERGVEVTTADITSHVPFYFVRPGDPAFRGLTVLLLASFSMVLLVACANMANFFMARSTARRYEMAVRTALGANRRRLVRQLLTEGVLLGLGAGALSVMAAAWICQIVWVEVQQRIIFRFTDLYVFAFSFVPSARVLAATCVVSVIAGALFSLTGAVQSSRVDLNEVLKHTEVRVAPTRRLRLNMRDLLIAVQVTLSVVLLVAAALLARGMVRGQSADPGFNTHDVLDIEFSGLDALGFDAARVASLREQLRSHIQAAPGVTTVSFATHVPLLGFGKTDLSIQGSATHDAFDNDVSPAFFAALGIPLTRGRDFNDADVANRAAVLIVSQATARNLWHGENPIGKWVLVGSKRRPMQVIGEAQDVRSVNIGSIEPYLIYLPLAPDAPVDDILIRTSGDARLAIPQVLSAAAQVDSRLPSLANAHSMDDALWFQRLPSTVATIFASFVGALALLLAVIGIYGTIAFAVAQRTREIGIRIALGATSRAIVRLVLSRIMLLAAASVCAGLALSVVVSRAMLAVPFGLQSMLLFGVSPRDPITMTAVAALLILVAALAAYRPAARATHIDPLVALRYE